MTLFERQNASANKIAQRLKDFYSVTYSERMRADSDPWTRQAVEARSTCASQSSAMQGGMTLGGFAFE